MVTGFGAARFLANHLPDNWRVVLVDRNSHLNRELYHTYVYVGGFELTARGTIENSFIRFVYVSEDVYIRWT